MLQTELALEIADLRHLLSEEVKAIEAREKVKPRGCLSGLLSGVKTFFHNDHAIKSSKIAALNKLGNLC